ncbi:dihydrolipoamide acetyltransferase family protein [Sediminibacterium sp. KACHI17]|uniref:Dihydrolipoamide acetyltransferase component of pyruvate dehydrogenase complex n=1 Tax=Sediminibacterium sp. KACHI17 TaxID=1751071 RepID=A0AAT9GGS6_9BACT
MAIAELVMPKLGESIMEATILKWNKKVGDHVKQDETVLDIATDKVDSEVPSTAEGVITEILFNVNDVVPIGTVIARINTAANGSAVVVPEAAPPAKEEVIVEQVSVAKEEVAPQPIATPVEAPIEEPIPFVPAAVTTELLDKPAVNRFYSPLVLNIANSEGISLSELERIPGTGIDGRVSKKDILQYVANKKSGISTKEVTPTAPVAPVQASPRFETSAKPTASASPVSEVKTITVGTPSGKLSDPAAVVVNGNTEIIEMDRMRKLIAKHMVDSKHTSPHVTSFAEADVTHMVQWRERVKHEFEKREGTKLTFTPMFIECIARVIERYPLINCSVDGDKIIVRKDINIGMATALPSGNLIVPVIKGANQLNIVGLSKAVNGLADAARNNKLKPDDTTGGTFTLTNVGTFGSLMGTPIISQPQVAILAVGAIKKRPMVIETKEGDTIGIRHMMYLSLSYDHRIVDGSIGASFLTEVAKEFEKWDPERQWFQYL